ncbi:hypothetical protein NIES4071_22700 [Calothrix sp. NIES-4071]|nr:hypothetical protein NIES4071_22700 [Calothrix sp. NIES-4071]BAZ56601.1 hypothetical protein NIES4105_22650 [Calothrix sp. NIES-4105]
MKLKNIVATAALTSLITVSGASVNTFTQSHGTQAVAMQVMSKQNNKDATGLTTSQKIDTLTKHKGQFGSGDELRRYFFGDLEPISVQPGGAGMVVNLYNKANNTTFAYCATYDVVVAIKQGRITAFNPSEVK